MKIIVLTVGKKHEPWVEPGIERYMSRLKKPYLLKFELIPHSGREGELAQKEESDRILSRLPQDSFVVLLDERGDNLSSPELARLINQQLTSAIYLVIGGAYGVDAAVKGRADVTWSLSNLVFPHQLVRLILTEQVYRAQEISRGSRYHHS